MWYTTLLLLINVSACSTRRVHTGVRLTSSGTFKAEETESSWDMSDVNLMITLSSELPDPLLDLDAADPKVTFFTRYKDHISETGSA
jgi:hypothetical protein